ncbi:MAG: nitroreductase family protein [Candidatus Woesearchaeota archaeon]
MNETIETIKARRSVRSFNDKPIPDGIIDELIECGRYAPSAMNQQPWRFMVIKDRDMIRQMSESIADEAKEKNPRIAERAGTMEDPIFYNAPLLIMVLRPKDDEWAKFDCSAAAQNMMLAARSLGIGSCAIGMAKLLEGKDVMEKLDMPDGYEQHMTIAFGYTDEWPEAPERKKDNVLCP